MPESDLGGRLRSLRLRRDMSQADLAGPDFSVSYISLVESGKRTPTAPTLAVLAGRLSVEPDYLVSGVQPHEREHRDLQLRYAQLALAQGEATDALKQLRGLAEVPDEPDEDFAWHVQASLAAAYEATGNLREAVGVLERLRERAHREPSRWPWIDVSISLSRCYREAGDLRRAVDVAEDALHLVHLLSPEPTALLPRLVSTLAMAYYERGDLTRAQQLLDRALDDANDSGSRVQRGAVLWNSSIMAAERGRHADALALADRALALIVEDDDARSLARLRVTRAWIELGRPDGDAKSALELLCGALPTLQESGSQVDIAYVETELARAELALGNPASGARHARSSLRRLGDEPRLERGRAHLCLAKCLAAQGEAVEAEVQLREAGSVLETLKADRQAAQVWRELADIQMSRGEVEKAADSFRRALDASGIPASAAPAPPVGVQVDDLARQRVMPER